MLRLSLQLLCFVCLHQFKSHLSCFTFNNKILEMHFGKMNTHMNVSVYVRMLCFTEYCYLVLVLYYRCIYFDTGIFQTFRMEFHTNWITKLCINEVLASLVSLQKLFLARGTLIFRKEHMLYAQPINDEITELLLNILIMLLMLHESFWTYWDNILDVVPWLNGECKEWKGMLGHL